MEASENVSPTRLTEIVDKLDCFTEQDMQQLTGAKRDTLSQWRRDQEGPSFIRAGTRFLYPRAAVAAWLASRVQERGQTAGKSQL